jgi:hypothetical protein
VTVQLALTLGLGAIGYVSTTAPLLVRYKRVGGIRFLRLGRYQFSFCRCRKG